MVIATPSFAERWARLMGSREFGAGSWTTGSG
jgi:hypothetical protein